jgi:hypothetical protein
MQVAIKIRVEPEARTDRTIRISIRRSLPATNHPPYSIRLYAFADQRVARETAPGLEVRAENRFAAGYGQEIARAALAKRTKSD